MSPVFKGNVRTAGDEINFSKIADLFWKRWYFIPLFLVLSLSVCKLYLRYTKPLYQAAGTLRLAEENSPIRDLGISNSLIGNMPNIDSEIQILSSKQLITAALRKLDVDVSYFSVGNFLVTEIYKLCPFKVIYDKESAVPYGMIFQVRYKGGSRITLSYIQGEEEVKKDYVFGESINVKGFKFRIIQNEKTFYLISPEINYQWTVNTEDYLVGTVRSGLRIDQMGYMVPLLRVSLTHYVKEFAADFINALCEVYVQTDMEYKTKAANQALDFIQSQIDTIEKKVLSAEVSLDQRRLGAGEIPQEIMSTTGITRLGNLEEARSAGVMTLMALQKLEKEVSKRESQLTPIPLAVTGSATGVELVQNLIQSYNDLTMERLKVLQRNTLNSPIVKEMDERIDELAKFILLNIQVSIENSKTQLAYYESEIQKSRESLRVSPQVSNGTDKLEREFKVTENIYTTLLQKRAESSITRASIVSSVRIVDQAAVPTAAISPNVRRAYSIAVGIGLAIALSLIFLSGLLKNTVSYKEEIEAISLTPIIGVVRKSSISERSKIPKLVILDNPKSALSESIRAIRTNLQFISSEKKSKVISITSTVSGEGKTFITVNLAGIISLLNRKVIILDLDLRKPKLHLSFGRDNSVGLSTFLVGKSELKDILQKTEYENLDLITSGPIPPNPSELLQSLKMELLMMELKKSYDYIVVDTPPVGIVTDGMNILRVSDVVLYVLRADFSRKPYTSIPDQLVEDHKVKNLYIVLNSVAQSGSRYGKYGKYGGYGQAGAGYYVEETIQDPWWKFWRRLRKSS